MKYRVKVPATSANIGAGFDVMGLALNLYNFFEVEEIESGFLFEGFEEEFCNEENIFLKSMIYLLEKYHHSYNGFKLSLKEENIPISRGLGSSSACIVAGLMIANKILGNKLSKAELVKIATDIEGHPDNVSPAILGGLVVTVVEDEKLYYNKIDIDNDIIFACYIPKFKIPTENARKILPEFITLNDGVYNVGHGVLTVLAFLNKDYQLLKISCNDKFHQDYRGALIKNYKEIKEIFNKNSTINSFISGSGPTIIGMFKKSDINIIEVLKKDLLNLKEEFNFINLIVDNEGAQVEER